MPSTTPERSDKWKSEGFAVSYLAGRGFRLTSDWLWVPPERELFDDEVDAIIYLIEEWDYGGLVQFQPISCMNSPEGWRQVAD